MIDILFGQSYFLKFDPKLWEAMQPYPPLGTLYAASYLRQGGYNVALFDAMLAESEAEWARSLDLHKPTYAVIYEDNFNYLTKMCLLRMRTAAFSMTDMAKKRGCTVIVAGSDATDHFEEYLARGADFVLIGEGEKTLHELLNALSGRAEKPLDKIQGLAFAEEKVVIQTSRRPDIRDLDALPYPAWDLVDIKTYRDIWLNRHGYFSMNMVTTRGCPYHCNWCAKPIWGQRYNARSPENVVNEMVWLRENYQPDHLWFVDDIFGLKPDWTRQFALHLQTANFRIPFKCLNRADLLLREGDIEALKDSGCRIAWIGAESGSQKILNAMEKGTKIEQIYEVTERLHEANIQVGFFLQFGYPGETMEDIRRTLQLVQTAQPDDIGISVSYPLPGTRFFNSVKDQMGAKQNWIVSDDLEMMYRGPFSTLFYRKLHSIVHKEFRSRQFIARMRSLKGISPRAILRYLYYQFMLPIERWSLNRLAKSPHQGVSIKSNNSSWKSAASPTPQNE